MCSEFGDWWRSCLVDRRCQVLPNMFSNRFWCSVFFALTSKGRVGYILRTLITA